MSRESSPLRRRQPVLTVPGVLTVPAIINH